MKPDKCYKCLRGRISRCSVLTSFIDPCWAYIDDMALFAKSEKERLAYLGDRGLSSKEMKKMKGETYD